MVSEAGYVIVIIIFILLFLMIDVLQVTLFASRCNIQYGK